MLIQYFSILVFLIVGIIIGTFPLLLGFLIGPRKPNAQKNSPYECGFEALSDARIPFDVRFYLVAILFILFDLETAFLFPWAAVLQDIGCKALIGMLIFLAILSIGFVYEWKRGALEWQ